MRVWFLGAFLQIGGGTSHVLRKAQEIMEEFLIAIFQFLFEVVLQSLFELPWDWFVGSRELRLDQSSKNYHWVVGSLLMGGAVGVISLFVRPNTTIQSSSFRVLYLVFAPVFSAMISLLIARFFSSRGRPWIQPRLHTICTFCFTVVVTVLRFTYAHRPL
jgi:hypothetical protein